MPIVTMFGGSGFIGRYAARKLAKRGWRVRAAVRRPNEAHFLRPYGDVGQIEPVQANIRDDDSCRRALEGADGDLVIVADQLAGAPQRRHRQQDQRHRRVACQHPAPPMPP